MLLFNTCCRGRVRTSDNRPSKGTLRLYQLSYTASVNRYLHVAYQAATYLFLFSPFLDIGAACLPPTLTTAPHDHRNQCRSRV